MKIRKNNEGAALVAVLIGVLFITILASSLLYMSTLNFQMKKMRYSSTDNFYTAEFAFEDMLSQIRQKTEKHATSVTTYEELQALLKGNTEGGYTHFNEQNLRNLIHIDGRTYGQTTDPSDPDNPPIIDGIAAIKVSTIYRTPSASDTIYKDSGAITRSTYEETGKSIILHGVKVTVTTDEAHGSYQSTVSMDIEFAFPEYTTKKAGSVSDFSILTDSPLYIAEGNHVFTGSMYARANGNTDIGAKNAFRVGSNCVASLLGPFAFFQGDVTVDEGGTLFLNGKTYINGNLRLSDKATVFLTGDLQVRGQITNRGVIRSASGASVKYGTSGANKTTVNWTHYDDKYSAGLAYQVTSDYFHMFVDPSNGTFSGYAGRRKNLELTAEQFRKFLGNKGDADFTTTGTVSGNTVTAMYSSKDADNGIHDDTLVIGFYGVSVRSQFKNCTYIDIGSYKNSSGETVNTCIKVTDNPTNANVTWGHMDEAKFQAAQKLFFVCSKTQIPGVDSSLGSVKFPTDSTAGLNTTMLEPDTSDGAETNQFILKKSDGTVVDKVILYANEGGNPYYRSLTKSGGSYTQYIPFGSLISSNMGEIMNDFYGGGIDNGGGGATGDGNKNGMPTIIIDHWTKE